MQAADDGYYTIKNESGDLYLDLTGGKEAAGTNIEVYKKSNTDAQKFKFLDNGNGSYTITTKATKDKSCIEIINAYTEDGANVQQWKRNGHDCQSWIIEETRYFNE